MWLLVQRGYAYDNNGNMTFDGAFTYGYDVESRMGSATGNGQNLGFKYDPFGRRYSKIMNGTTTTYLHDGTRETAEYTNVTGTGATLSARHIFSGDDSVLATIKDAYTNIQFIDRNE